MSYQSRTINSAFFVSLIFLGSMLIAIEIGVYAGQRARDSKEAVAEAHVLSVHDSMFGIVALTLGFSLAASLERHRTRQMAVVHESNAIGTAYLRCQLIPESVRELAKARVRDYLCVRAQTEKRRLHQLDDSMSEEVNRKHAELWGAAAQATAQKDAPATALFAASINEVIDSYATRRVAFERFMPMSVTLLLLVTFLLTGGVSGFASGLESHRPSIASYLLTLVITIQTFLVIDLDRPRTGLMRVRQDSLLDLQASVESGS